MKPIDFHPEAAMEVRDASNRYESLRASLGRDFQKELRAALERIRDNPLAYAAESGQTRICPLHRFPYGIYYQILDDRIWVAAFGHHSRRPGYWAHRRPN